MTATHRSGLGERVRTAGWLARARRRERALLRAPRPRRSPGCAIAWPSGSPGAGGCSPSASPPPPRSDVRHVAVEFVHPVIVGKRALPALGLVGDAAPRRRRAGARRRARRHRHRLRRAGGRARRSRDAVAAARRPRLPDGRLRAARRRVGAGAAEPTTRSSARSWPRRPTTCCGSSSTCSSSTAGCWRAAPSNASTTSAPRASCTRSSPSASTISTPCSPTWRARCVMKADEVQDLRARTLTGSGAALSQAAAAALRRAYDGGGRLLALGNGGSATDATDVVADFSRRRRARLAGAARARPDRRHGDHHRAGQRHRPRGDLRAAGDRLRPGRGRAGLRCRRAATR